MALHSVHKIFHPNHPGEEKQQMLNLNRRLETYLSRVKVLEEENALLAKEIQVTRCNNHGALTRRKGMEEELRQARLEVDAAVRDRFLTQLEVGKLTEELEALDMQRQREAQAQVKAKTMLEQSRRELEEEHRVQIWLREQVNQLEHEMRLLVQTHQEDVAHLEATSTRSRTTTQYTFAQRGNREPNLLQLGEQYSQSTSRAWQEAAEAYQDQLARLEESLSQARSRLTQVGQEKSESQLKLRALEKEMASAQVVRLHLEKTAAQQRDGHGREIQQLHEHLEGLEAEREELGQQIDHLLLENRSLLQMKMSLGLEVATYRALLDNESLRGDVSLSNQPRNISITDAVFSSQNYQRQPSTSHKTTSLSSVRGVTGPTAMTATPIWSRKSVTLNETPNILGKPANTETAIWETPYPKILQDGAVENFRPQEVHEKVTYAEPLSPPNERESFGKTSGDIEGEEDWINADVEQVVESVVSDQAESGLSREPSFINRVGHNEFTTPGLTSYHVRVTEEPCSLSDESDKDVAFEEPAEKEDVQQSHAPVEAWVKKECTDKEEERVQEETSDSKTEAVLQPSFESRPSSPDSQCEPEESAFNQETDYNRDENISNDDAVERRHETSCSLVGTNETDVEDKLYPDGEEMDTWDSVIERKVDLKTDDGVKNEGKRQHAEPEEDISGKEPVHEKREIIQGFVRGVAQDDKVASSLMITHVDDGQQDDVPISDNDDDDEDSQNVSVSWRTELEGDSYAQENTLADTRPLIRYKSDETDANTQASHMDESESSEGEQEKKIGETGTGTWSEGKSKKFGTMEDLCEEVEAETVDEDYNLGYTQAEDRDVDHGTIESATPGNDPENVERMISEGRSDEETEEFPKPMVHANVDYDVELETDRLVEQELEGLSTDRYSAHFAQQQVSEEMLHLTDKSDDEMTEGCVEPGMAVNHELISSATTVDHTFGDPFLSDWSVVMSQTDSEAEEEIQHEDQEAIHAPEKREEEEEHNVSMATHADATEDHSGFGDFINRPDMEEINNSEVPNLSVTADQKNLQDAAAPSEVKEAVLVEASHESQEREIGDEADSQELPEGPGTAEWEDLENPEEDFKRNDQKCDRAPDSVDEGAMTHEEEPLEISPDNAPDESDIFKVKDSTDSGLHGYFPSGVKNDFWASSLESGATYQPDDACNEAAEQTNQDLGFADQVVWPNLENPNVVNGNSRVGIDSSKVKKEQEQMRAEVKQVLCRNEEELVHSEESEVEGESWSSGDEPV
ncbi:nestin [Embiotoca jacksoni]|uniref:nestin n=1 Tax=Embiotoca jacksoni TaxID=100190 RepID=UPI0037047738